MLSGFWILTVNLFMQEPVSFDQFAVMGRETFWIVLFVFNRSLEYLNGVGIADM